MRRLDQGRLCSLAWRVYRQSCSLASDNDIKPQRCSSSQQSPRRPHIQWRRAVSHVRDRTHVLGHLGRALEIQSDREMAFVQVLGYRGEMS